MSKNHIVFLTEGEMRALLNFARLASQAWEDNPYVQRLQNDGGKTAYDKLMEKILEVKRESQRE